MFFVARDRQKHRLETIFFFITPTIYNNYIACPNFFSMDQEAKLIKYYAAHKFCSF